MKEIDKSNITRIVYDDNSVYTGATKNGVLREGYGRQTWPDGTM